MGKIKKGKGEVRVIGFISSGEFHDDSVKDPIGEDYMSDHGEIPKELIDEMKNNGWENNGNICFPEDFQPDPVIGEDGNVYLCMSDTTLKNEVLSTGLIMKSMMMREGVNHE